MIPYTFVIILVDVDLVYITYIISASLLLHSLFHSCDKSATGLLNLGPNHGRPANDYMYTISVPGCVAYYQSSIGQKTLFYIIVHNM